MFYTSESNLKYVTCGALFEIKWWSGKGQDIWIGGLKIVLQRERLAVKHTSFFEWAPLLYACSIKTIKKYFPTKTTTSYTK